MKIGEGLKRLRTEKGLTQEEVAKAIGVSRRTYLSYENEDRRPRNSETYEKLAGVLGCDGASLMNDEEKFIIASAAQYGARGKKQAEELVTELSGLFAGGELSEDDKDALFRSLQRAYVLAKEDNKKYTRKDYLFSEKG